MMKGVGIVLAIPPKTFEKDVTMKFSAHFKAPRLDKDSQAPRILDQEEALVVDDRDQVSPAEAVERKLVSKLPAVQLSHVRFARRALSRSHC
jgi:hypothetical protein